MTPQLMDAQSAVILAEKLGSMSIPEPTEFPQEIVDLFVEGLSQYLEEQDARRAFQACLFVSRSFSAPARKYILHTLVVTARTSTTDTSLSESALRGQMLELSQLIESPFNFKSLIRKVCVDVTTDGMILWDSSGLELVLDALRSHAKNLETFWITGIGESLTDWSREMHPMERPLVDLLSSRNWRCLRFEDICNIPPNILATCRSIQSLEIISATFGSQASSPSDKPIQPDELFVYRSTRSFNRDLSKLNIDLSKLTRFRASVTSGALAMWDLAQKAKDSIQSLDMEFGHNHPFLNDGLVDLSSLPKLSQLQLRIKMGSERLYSDSMPKIFRLLNPRTHPTQLKSIRLRFECAIRADYVHEVMPSWFTNGNAAWRALDPDTLRRKHPRLRQLDVKLKVNLYDYGNFYESADLSDVEKREIARALRDSERERLRSLLLPSSITEPSSVRFDWDVVAP